MIDELKTDYKQDILMPSENGKRTFDIVDKNGNVLFADVHIEDKSSYLQVGDEYGQEIINEQNSAINQLAKGAYLRYETYAEYETAYANGEVPVGSFVIIDELTNDNLTALQVAYNNSNVKNALDGLSANTVKNNANNTLIGVQSLKATNISRGQSISVGTYGDANISFVDKDYKRLGFIQTYQNTDGSTDIKLNMDSANPNGRFKISVFKDYTNAITGETDTTAGGTIRKGNETIYYDISFKLNSTFSGLKQIGHINTSECYPYAGCIGQVYDSNFQLFGSALIKGNSDIIVRTSQQLSANTYYYIKALGMVQNQN